MSDKVISDAAVAVKIWPFRETPGEFRDRVVNGQCLGMDLLGALRFALIENPPMLSGDYVAAALPHLSAQSGECSRWVLDGCGGQSRCNQAAGRDGLCRFHAPSPSLESAQPADLEASQSARLVRSGMRTAFIDPERTRKAVNRYAETDVVETVPQQPAPSVPDGYMHRYPDGAIRHSNGREINGSKPIESIPYFYGAAIPCGKQAAPTPTATEQP